MLPRYENRVQLVLALVVGMLLVANLFTLTLVAMTPPERSVRAPVLFAVFTVTLLVSLPGIFLLPRWLARPYRRLVGEAERAPVAARPEGARDETEFVLETFQAVVAQLRQASWDLRRRGTCGRSPDRGRHRKPGPGCASSAPRHGEPLGRRLLRPQVPLLRSRLRHLPGP